MSRMSPTIRRSEFCKKHTRFTLSFSFFALPQDCSDCLGDIERDKMIEQQFVDDLQALRPYIQAVLKRETEDLKDLRVEMDALKAGQKRKEVDSKPKFKMLPHPQPWFKKNFNSSMILNKSVTMSPHSGNDDLNCQICMNLVNEPKQCSYCDKLYCNTCIQLWLK